MFIKITTIFVFKFYIYNTKSDTSLYKTKNMSNVEKLEKTERSEKFKALKLTMDKIDKDFGKGSVMMMSDKGVFAPDFSFTVDCDNPPDTTKALVNAAVKLAIPSESNSCLGLMV